MRQILRWVTGHSPAQPDLADPKSRRKGQEALGHLLGRNWPLAMARSPQNMTQTRSRQKHPNYTSYFGKPELVRPSW